MRISAVGFVLSFFLVVVSNILVGAESDTPSKIRFSGIPALGFGPDSGFGFGAVGAMYVDKENFLPYKLALGIKIYLTTKGVNSHAIQLDQIKAFGLPLRLTTRLGFYSTIAQNYCGRASDATCNLQDAELEENQGKLMGDERERFINHYYKNRFMSFYGDLASRWLLWKDQAKLGLMLSYRGSYYLTRDFKQNGPYEGSLYQKDFSDQKTDGYLSALEVGLMLDKRDNEPAPTSGYWLESSVRGSSFLIGSAWDYFGGNAAARFYLPLDHGRRLVVASQTIADVIVGNLPYDAMSRIGGSQTPSDFTAIGGQFIGRGIREQRFVGRIKLIEQAEFRYNFWSFALLKQNFDLNFALMADLGMTAWDFSRFTKDMQNLYTGFGGGLRINWNKTFVIRADLGVSPNEDFSPKFYLVVGNVF